MELYIIHEKSMFYIKKNKFQFIEFVGSHISKKVKNGFSSEDKKWLILKMAMNCTCPVDGMCKVLCYPGWTANYRSETSNLFFSGEAKNCTAITQGYNLLCSILQWKIYLKHISKKCIWKVKVKSKRNWHAIFSNCGFSMQLLDCVYEPVG